MSGLISRLCLRLINQIPLGGTAEEEGDNENATGENVLALISHASLQLPHFESGHSG